MQALDFRSHPVGFLVRPAEFDDANLFLPSRFSVRSGFSRKQQRRLFVVSNHRVGDTEDAVSER